MKRAVQEELKEMSRPIFEGPRRVGLGSLVSVLGDRAEAVEGCETLFVVDGEAIYARDDVGVEDTVSSR